MLADDFFVMLRHGETNFHTEGRYQGGSDDAQLTERGKIQTLELRRCLEQLHITNCYSSPIGRAVETLGFLDASLANASRKFDDRLREVEIAEWVGLLKSEIRERDPNSLTLWKHFPHQLFDKRGGRPLLELYGRIRSFVDSIRHVNGGKLIVGHDHVNRSLISTLLNIPIELHASLPQASSSISIVETVSENGRPALRTSNLEHHEGRAKAFETSLPHPRVILVRHGVTDANVGRVYQGTDDAGLSDRGREQIGQLSELLEGIKVNTIISSALIRARESASILPFSSKSEYLHDSNLNEFFYGRWQGMSEREVEQRFPEDRTAWRMMSVDRPIPDGESLSAFTGRVVSSLSKIWEVAQKNGVVVVVAHDVVIRTIITLSLGLNFRKLWAFPISNAGVTELVKGPIGTALLKRHNIMAGSLESRYGNDYL